MELFICRFIWQNFFKSVSKEVRNLNNLIPTTGTDFHHPGHEGMSALLTQTEIQTSKDIVDVLRSGDYIFEIGGSILMP